MNGTSSPSGKILITTETCILYKNVYFICAIVTYGCGAIQKSGVVRQLPIKKHDFPCFHAEKVFSANWNVLLR